MEYEIVIGLEVHAQLNTKSKIFCGCSTAFGAEPNTQTCPVCLGFPGSLPVLNKKVLHLGAKAAIALNCKIANKIKFDRKNYFYPDLPKAYQISQLHNPLAENGFVVILINGAKKTIRIKRAHLEEDAGKLLHHDNYSLVDFNRAGTPLLEIVTEPDISSPEEAYEYLTTLKAILEYTGVSDCNMEEGSLRCDANISLREKGAKELGSKAEVKNMNSFKAVKEALAYESKRQEGLLNNKTRVVQETRLYNAEKGVTESMRSKEEAHDYRYFPEPDLSPFNFDKNLIEEITKEIPELPEPKKKRFISEYNLSEYDAGIMVNDKAMAAYFEKCVSLYRQPKLIANWLMGDISAYMKENKLNIANLSLKEEHLVGMINMIDKGAISGKTAKTLITEIIQTKKSPETLVKEKGLEQISDSGEIERVVEEVIKENQKIVADFKNGKVNALTALIGKVMAKTKGRANPVKVNDLLKQKIN